jgi:amino acid transporter
MLLLVYVFAVFFPAVTGFTAGVAMSGDLRDPRRAIPLGTMTAIVVGMIVYLVIPIYLGLTVDPAALRTDQMIWLTIARFAPLVVAGVSRVTAKQAAAP